MGLFLFTHPGSEDLHTTQDINERSQQGSLVLRSHRRSVALTNRAVHIQTPATANAIQATRLPVDSIDGYVVRRRSEACD